MNTLARMLKTMLLLFTVGMVLAGVGYLWFQIEIFRPYEEFRSKEMKIIPLLDSLNEKVAETLPPLPPNSDRIDKYSNGITSPAYNHGRWLFIKVSTTLRYEAISSYYRQYLLDKGWSINFLPYTRQTDDYFHESSCISIYHWGTGYWILIWHDLQSQTFSPKPPNLDFMRFLEYGETSFAECP